MSLEKLKEIQHELKTQDNRCTADPIFLVEECERIYGMDSDYSDNYIWYNREDCYEADGEEAKILDDLEDNYKGIPSCWVQSYYIEKWVAVQSFFTEKAALDFAERNKHRHAGKLRVYADSLYRNHEMKLIRDYILNLE